MNDFQKQALLQLFMDFYEISGQRTAIFDKHFQVVLEYPDHNPFCAQIRKSEEGVRRCRDCDLYGLNAARESESYVVYRCHANLIEVCTPIRDDCGIVGYLMFGQLVYSRNLEEQMQKTLAGCADLFPNREEMTRLYLGLRRASPEYVCASANILLTCASYIQANQLMRATQNPLWIQIQDYIHQNTGRAFSLKRMAEELHASVPSICATAKACSGQTVIQLLTERRVQTAGRYLLNTDLQIAEIAEKVGIDDYNYFSRIFKKQTGVSPRQYRKEKGNFKNQERNRADEKKTEAAGDWQSGHGLGH